MLEVINTTRENVQISKYKSVLRLNKRPSDLCFAICRFSQVVFITSSNLTHNLLFYFLWFLVLIINKMRYEKRDTNDSRNFLLDGESESCQFLRHDSCEKKSAITPQKKKDRTLKFLLNVFHKSTNQVASKSQF